MNPKRLWKLSLTIWTGVVMLVWLITCIGQTQVDEPILAQGIGPRPLIPYLAHFHMLSAADKWAVLVDLSDTTNFPHHATDSIILKQLQLDGALSAANHWDTSVGVVTGVYTTGTDIEWIRSSTPIEAALIRFDSTWTVPEHGLNLSVSNGSLPFVVSNEITTTGLITSATVLSSTGAFSTMVGIGDLILWADEIVDGAAFTLTVEIAYDTE